MARSQDRESLSVEDLGLSMEEEIAHLRSLDLIGLQSPLAECCGAAGPGTPAQAFAVRHPRLSNPGR